MDQWLLIVGGGIETIPGVKRAQELGLKVVVSDRNQAAPCFSLADACILADTYDARATFLAALKHTEVHGPIAGVMCLGSDIPWTVAVVAKALGVSGLSLETAALGADKLAMKERLRACGVAVPDFRPIASHAALEERVENWGLPLVVKPVDSRGARGVILVDDALDRAWAFDYAKEMSPTGRVMVERYLAGPQLSTESLVVNGTAHTPGMSDRNYERMADYKPFFIEDGGDLPSYLPDEVIAETRKLVQQAATAMGVMNGVVKGDVVVHDGKPYIIEVATRLSGGYFCTHTIPMNTGVDLVGNVIRQAVGWPVHGGDLEPKRQAYVCQRYLFPKPGRVLKIEGEDQVRTMAGLEYLELRVKPGDVIAPIQNHPGRAGVLMTTGTTRAQAQARAAAAVAGIRFTVD